MSRIFILLLLISFLMLSCRQETNQSPTESYTVDYRTKPLTIDGRIDDPAWNEADWSSNFVDIEGVHQDKPLFDTHVKMLWDRHYLYIAARLEETDLNASLTDRDAIIYRDNDFEVFIDPDGDQLNYYEYEVNALGTVMDLFLAKPYNQGGKADLAWDFRNLKSAVTRQGTLNDPSDLDTSWTVELAIPWRAFTANEEMIPPKNGDTWRMNFSRVQWQYDTLSGNYIKRDIPEKNWVWSPMGEINMHIPSRWGYVTFTGRPEVAQENIPQYWIWSGYDAEKTDQEWDSTLSMLKEAGITGLLLQAGPEGLQKVIPMAAKYGIEVHAWFWTMNRGDAKPEWLSYNREGQSLADRKAYVDYYRFMCPAIPEVQDFVLQKMDALAGVEGLSGIHMDYIRYVDAILPRGLWDKYGLIQDHIMPEFDYGYHPLMRSEFKAIYGYDPPEREDVGSDSLWLAFRLNALNDAVIRFRDFIHQQGLDVSAAVFPTPQMATEMVRQDWSRWDLDFYFPMVYHNFYLEDTAWIRQVMEINRRVIPKETKIFCGLYLPALAEKTQLSDAMASAYRGGADGIAFFDLRALQRSQLIQIKEFIRQSESNRSSLN